MPPIPDQSNFYSKLQTSLSREQVADLYGAVGWRIRKSTRTDFEVICPWAELIIEAESPIVMHGPVADILAHANEIFAPLRRAGVSFAAECYGPDDELLQTFNEL